MLKVIIQIVLIMWITAALITGVTIRSEAQSATCWQYKTLWASEVLKFLDANPKLNPQNSYVMQYNMSSYTIIYKDKCND